MSKPDDIPEDLLKRAQDYTGDIETEFVYSAGVIVNRATAIEAVARAMLSERVRCEDLCTEILARALGVGAVSQDTSRSILAAITKGSL